MSLAVLIPLVLKASVLLAVFALGLRASPADATYLIRRPGQLVQALVAIYVVMPLWAATLALTFEVHPAVEVALLALAVSPIPPMLPKQALQAEGDGSYALGLLVAAGLLSIVCLPISVKWLASLVATPVAVPTLAIVRLIFSTVILPLAAGMSLRCAAPSHADRIALTFSGLATLLLVAGGLLILVLTWPLLVALTLNGTVIAMAALAVVGMAAGHYLGGPDPQDRAVLAIATAARHPGVAMALAGATFPGQRQALAAVLLYTIVSALACIPCVAWRRRDRVVRPAVT